MKWDPEKYGQYADERGRPFVDLLARVGASAPRRVVDLGCGPGNLTALLRDRWPSAAVEGIDSSPEMIAAAGTIAGVTFRVGDITSWQPESDVDVLISNAALQWVPGHTELVRRWCAALPEGAWLAFHVPGNFDSPSHALMRSLAASDRWRDALTGVLRHHDAVAAPCSYAALLLRAGLVPDVWETTYLHVLTGPDPVLEWMRGTGLRPVLSALPPDEAAAFEAAYAALLRDAYPAGPHGTILPYRRIFCVAHKR